MSEISSHQENLTRKHPNFSPLKSLEQKLNSEKLIRIFQESIKNPEGFWEKYSNIIAKNFAERRFTTNDEEANTAIIIPVHNDIEKGHLLAVLCALSQLEIPNEKKVIVLIISHNTEDHQNKKLKEILESIGNPVELIIYNNENLKGPSYPIQLGVNILPDNIEEVGFIDDDTVVPPDWLMNMSEAIKKGYDIAVAPRIYLNNKGEEIPYSKIKTAFELLYPRIKKLIMGNSYFNLKKLRELINPHLGAMVDDGFIQEKASQKQYKLALVKQARAVSDGEKYANLKRWELITSIYQRIRNIGLGITNTKDHVEFLLLFLPRYYPNFKKFIESKYPNIYQDYAEGKITNLGKLLQQLKECYEEFNKMNKPIMEEDISRIKNSRKQNQF